MANLKRIEALADAIAFVNKSYDPESVAYQLRSPGLTKVYSFKHLASSDNMGRRIFTSWIGGYRHLVQDLVSKCSGDTRAKGNNGKLQPTSNISDLLVSFKLNTIDNIFTLVDFLIKALKDDSISSETELSYFLKD